MSGRSSRNKGAVGEREFNAMLGPVVTQACNIAGTPGIALARNFAQASAGGCDLDSLAHLGFAFEVKRHETLQVNTWWAQIERAALPLRSWPILAYRQNRKDWTFVVDCRMLWIEAKGRVFMEQAVFLSFFEKTLVERLRRFYNMDTVATKPHEAVLSEETN
jgi:hypothetical protein